MTKERPRKKVLIYVPKIYEPEQDLFTGDKSGLAMYVHEIADSIKEQVSVYILTYKFTKAVVLNNLNYVSHTKKDFFSGLNVQNVARGLKKAVAASGGVKLRLKALYWACDIGSFEAQLKALEPDIVHFHGANPELMEQISICRKYRVPFLVTLHGFVGDLQGKGAVRATQRSERRFLQEADKQGWPVTVVSSGAKRRACEMYHLSGDNISVILNGTNISVKSKLPLTSEEIHARYGLRPNCKIITCVGTICERKNQEAVVRAWTRLSTELREEYAVLFLGVDRTEGRIQAQIGLAGAQSELVLCGFVDSRELPSYYQAADLNILASVDEGFGLSIIEAMRYGVPTLTFRDLDAIDDLYDPTAMLLVEDRTDNALARGIRCALEKKWDHSAITAASQRYLMDNIGRQYTNLYHEVISKWVW